MVGLQVCVPAGLPRRTLPPPPLPVLSSCSRHRPGRRELPQRTSVPSDRARALPQGWQPDRKSAVHAGRDAAAGASGRGGGGGRDGRDTALLLQSGHDDQVRAAGRERPVLAAGAWPAGKRARPLISGPCHCPARSPALSERLHAALKELHVLGGDGKLKGKRCLSSGTACAHLLNACSSPVLRRRLPQTCQRAPGRCPGTACCAMSFRVWCSRRRRSR